MVSEKGEHAASTSSEQKQPAVQGDVSKDNQPKPPDGTSKMGLEADEFKKVMLALAQKVTTKSSTDGEGDSSKDKVIKSDLKIPNLLVREVGQRA